MKAKARLAFLTVMANGLLLVPVASATAAPVPGDPCPNGDIRQAQGVSYLPDCMALEMVSPPSKNSKRAETPDVSADGERVSFKSNAALGGTPGVLTLRGGDRYVATRDPSGVWTTEPTVPPVPFSQGWLYEDSNAGAASMTPDFACWLQIASTRQLAQLGVSRAFRGCLGRLFTPLSSLLTPTGGLVDESPELILDGNNATRFIAASADHSHLFFRPGASRGSETGTPITSYLPGDPGPAGAGSSGNTYVAKPNAEGEPSLELLARGRDTKDGKLKVWGGNCGSLVGGPENRNQGAVSFDGSRVYFSTRPDQPVSGTCSTGPKLRILERRTLERLGGSVVSTIGELFSSECTRIAPACSSTDGDDLYQGASVDQTKVYFMTNRQLANSDLDEGSACSADIGASAGCDLYLFDAGEPLGQRLIQVSAGEEVAANVAPKHEAGKGANVLAGTVAISGDGSHVYFVAEGALTEDKNPEGESADEYPAATPKLYVYMRNQDHPDGELAFLGPLVSSDRGDFGLWGTKGTFANFAYPVPAIDRTGSVENGGDGHILLFGSEASLTADDADGGARDVFRYDAEVDVLERVSKAPAGGMDGGSFDVLVRGEPNDALGTDYAEKGRWVSEDGETVVFTTAEGLAPGDEDARPDSYLWSRGRLMRLPGSFGGTPTMSHDGSTIAFESRLPLLRQDGDNVRDVYVAREGGGFPSPATNPPCEPDRGRPGPHCRDNPSSSPGAASTASSEPNGTGNLKSKRRACPKSKRRVVRKGTTRCLKRKRRACPKGERRVVRKGKARCVKRKGAERARHTNFNGRAGK